MYKCVYEMLNIITTSVSLQMFNLQPFTHHIFSHYSTLPVHTAVYYNFLIASYISNNNFSSRRAIKPI